MARSIPTESGKPRAPDITWRGYHTLDERESRIREAAYYRYLQHGCCDGHDLDDWFEAEAELEHGSAVPPEAPPLEVQQSSVHGAACDDEMKRMVRRHPHKAIPMVDSVEPAEAPPKE